MGVGVGAGVCVLLRGRSVDAGGAVGGLYWVVLVGHVHIVWRVRGFLTMV